MASFSSAVVRYIYSTMLFLKVAMVTCSEGLAY